MKLRRKLKKIKKSKDGSFPIKKSKSRSNGAAFKLLPGCPQGGGNVNILVFPQAERGHAELTPKENSL